MTGTQFCSSYHEDRAAFDAEIERFRARTGRDLSLRRFAVDAEQDLTVTLAEFPARRPERVYVACCGIHGIEGFAGSAILRELLAGPLAALPAENTGLVLVHALNPHGFHHGLRVNRDNVDLNRNCAVEGEALFGGASPEFAALRTVLCPERPYRDALSDRLRFYVALGQALARSGPRALRQATLGGQYIDRSAVFYGGARVEPEIGFFQEMYARVARTYTEVLLTDLHTGYGARGQAYPLFMRADSSDFRAAAQGGTKADGSADKAYTVHGDLVGYCYATSKRLSPAGTFNGLVVEVGTRGLSTRDQLADLYTVIAENQSRQHGAADRATGDAIRASFREFFYPSDPVWRRNALRVGVDTLTQLLRQRHYL